MERGGFRMRKEQLERQAKSVIRRKGSAGEKECQGWDENNQGGVGRQRQATKCRTTSAKEEEGDTAVLVYGRNPGETPFIINICNERNICDGRKRRKSEVSKKRSSETEHAKATTVIVLVITDTESK